MAFLKEEHSLTIPSAYDGNKVYQLARQDDSLVVDCLLGLLQATCVSLNVTKSLNNFQALEIVYMIMGDFKILTIESITLAFKNGKAGKYGPTYNRLDIEIISGWLRAFSSSDEYIDQIERSNRKFVESKEPVTQAARDMAAKLKQTILEAEKGISRRDPKRDAIAAEIRKQRLINSIYTKSDSELKQMKKEFEEEKYITGVDIISTELTKRKNKK